MNIGKIQRFAPSTYRKHWKSYVRFKVPGQTGPFVEVLKISLILILTEKLGYATFDREYLKFFFAL